MPHQNVGQKKKSKRNRVSTFSGKNESFVNRVPQKKKSNKTNSTFSGTYLPKRSKLNVIFK